MRQKEGIQVAWSNPAFEFWYLLHLKDISRELTPAEKRKAYLCDITYTTNSEVGFDYLRDNMVTRKEDRVLRPLNFALVDEVDSILVDESRTPLIISGGSREQANYYTSADKFVKHLTENEDYEIDIKGKNIQLTEQGVSKGERFFKEVLDWVF